MTTNKGPWILLALAVGVLALSFFAGRWTASNAVEVGVGAPGTRAGIEEYIPYIKYNDGYYSLLGITTAGDLSVAAGTFSGDVTVSGGTASVPTTNTATSTIAAGCVETNATSTASVGHLEYSTSAISTTTFAGTKTGYPALLVPGACPRL